MHSRSIPSSSAAVDRSNSALLTFATSPICERLEDRRYLSTTIADASISARLRTHTVTEQELASHGLVALDIDGDKVYAKAGEWIAKLHLTHDLPTAEAAVARLGMGARLRKTLGRSDIALIELPRGIDYARLRSRFEQLGLGAYIEPNGIALPATTEPDDPRYKEGDQWGLEKIVAPEAWDLTVFT